MKFASCLVLSVAAFLGCARHQPQPTTPSVPPPPLPEVTRAADPPVWSDPTRQPHASIVTPAGWTEVAPAEVWPEADIVLVHESGDALISIVLRMTDWKEPADHAEEFVTRMPEPTTTSLIAVTASGDRAWFTWTRHPTPRRTHGMQGKMLFVRFPTVPERMVVVTGIWPQGRLSEFTPAFDRVGDSVALQ